MAKGSYRRFQPGKNGENLLPVAGIELAQKGGGLKKGSGWAEAYCKNNGQKPEDWIVTTNEGTDFGMNAICVTFFYDTKKKEVRAIPNWSMVALHRTIMSIKKGLEPPLDPNYEE